MVQFVNCDRCGREIIDSEEGIPLREVASVDPDGNPGAELVVADSEKFDGPRLIFAVVDADGEASDYDICTECAALFLEEYAGKQPEKSEDGEGEGEDGDDD